MKHTITAYRNVQDATGQGMEALVDSQDRVIGLLYNGCFITSTLSQPKVGLSMVDGPTKVIEVEEENADVAA